MGGSGHFRLPKRSIGIVIFGGLVSAVRWAILAAVLILLAPSVLSYVENARAFAVTRVVYQAHDEMLRVATPYIRGNIPTRISGRDRTDWILAAALAVFGIFLGSVRRRIEKRSTAKRMNSQIERWKSNMQIQEGSKAAATLAEQFKGFENAKAVDRRDLLRIFAETKKKLDAMGREVAFLSIDVVDSTGMKVGEESSVIESDFMHYKHLVSGALLSNGALKSTWTPDGVMACFPTVDAAVQAGKDVILQLTEFNKNTKLITRDFAVRCGVNAGYVHFDATTPLEEISDRVIDIAGHMQKHAEPNTIAVARKVIEPLQDLSGFQPVSKTIDGYDVSCWGGGPGRTQANHESDMARDKA